MLHIDSWSADRFLSLHLVTVARTRAVQAVFSLRYLKIFLRFSLFQTPDTILYLCKDGLLSSCHYLFSGMEISFIFYIYWLFQVEILRLCLPSALDDLRRMYFHTSFVITIILIAYGARRCVTMANHPAPFLSCCLPLSGWAVPCMHYRPGPEPPKKYSPIGRFYTCSFLLCIFVQKSKGLHFTGGVQV